MRMNDESVFKNVVVENESITAAEFRERIQECRELITGPPALPPISEATKEALIQLAMLDSVED